MQVVASAMTVMEFLRDLDRGDIKVNKQYQRSPNIWPEVAQAFFIETILSGYPIPKIALYPVTDVRTRTTHREIVDGQQRTYALQAFATSELRLPRNSELDWNGKVLTELSEEEQRRFHSFALPIDLYVGATDADIREIFRRMNAYTAPLNPEEQRHAKYQGAFKWFILRESTTHSQLLKTAGTFGESQLSRMADAKLIAEVLHALLNGFKTITKAMLDKLYKDFDGALAEEDEFRNRLHTGFDALATYRDMHETVLVAPYNLFAFLLAATHVRRPVPLLNQYFPVQTPLREWRSGATRELGRMAEAVENPEAFPDLRDYAEACHEGTNVAERRKTRFLHFCRALVA